MKIQKLFLAILLSISFVIKVQSVTQANTTNSETCEEKESKFVKAMRRFEEFNKELDELIERRARISGKYFVDENTVCAWCTWCKETSPLHAFFFTGIYRKAAKYEKLGILDDVLKTYFKKTGMSPDTSTCSNGEKVDVTFFGVMAAWAFSHNNASILVEKLERMGADAKKFENRIKEWSEGLNERVTLYSKRAKKCSSEEDYKKLNRRECYFIEQAEKHCNYATKLYERLQKEQK